MIRALLLTLSILSTPLLADDSLDLCGKTKDENTSVDLRREGGSMAGIPNLDQDGKPFCFIYSTSVALSAWMRTHSKGIDSKIIDDLILSPAVGATMHMESSCSHSCGYYQTLKRFGGCSSNKVVFADGDDYQLMDSVNESLGRVVRWDVPGSLATNMDEITNLLKDRGEVNDRLRETIPKLVTDKYAHEKFHKRTAEEIKTTTEAVIRHLEWPVALAAVIAPECVEITSETDKTNYTVYYGTFKGNLQWGQKYLKDGSQLADAPSCEYATNHTYTNRASTCPSITTTPKTPSDYQRLINEHFDQPDSQPLVVDYCWAFLLDGDSTPPEWKNGKPKSKCPGISVSPTIDHKSLLIGRRFNKNKMRCEYLLRNSWGNDCNSYHGSNEMTYDELTNYYRSCREELEKTGHADIWVPAETMVNNMHGYTRFK